MADILIDLLRRIVFKGAYRLGKQLGKELREAPSLFKYPPPYDQLTDAQKIFAGSREEYEISRKRILSQALNPQQIEILQLVTTLIEGVSENTLSDFEYNRILNDIKNRYNRLSSSEKETLNNIVQKYI